MYSYGILLLELFTGKSPTDQSFTGGLSLKNWVEKFFPTYLAQVLDLRYFKMGKIFGMRANALSLKFKMIALSQSSRLAFLALLILPMGALA